MAIEENATDTNVSRNGITIEEAVVKLNEIYKQAIAVPYVKRPVAWAIYQTWKLADKAVQKK